MEQKEQETPVIPVAQAQEPTGDVAQEPGAEGADLASTARSPEVEVPTTGEGVPVAEGEVVEQSGTGATEAAAAAGTEVANPSAPEVRPYRPTDDYIVGERIYHPVWDATGVVTERDPREQVFHMAVGGVDEPGRCHLIRVQFEKEVPASGGAKREVLLIADWHGRSLETGGTTAPRPSAVETLMGLGETSEEPISSARTTLAGLPEIPELESDLEQEDLEDSEGEEDIQPIGI